MPELPDVEVFKRYLDATALHQTILRISIRDEDILKDVSRRTLQRRLKKAEFESTRRHGKHLFVESSKGGWLRLHFGMTGFLRYYREEEKEPEHAHVVFDFSNGYHLAYDCQRKFGVVGFVPDVDEFITEKKLGPDARDIDLRGFRDLLRGRRGAIKSTLMNQQILCGLGNIYSDEILFHARIHPEKETNRLDDEAIEAIFRAMGRVVEKAIDFQADPEKAPKTWMLAHRAKGGDCPRCGKRWTTGKVGGRTAYFCTRCQSK